jgi:hypothetical protein
MDLYLQPKITDYWLSLALSYRREFAVTTWKKSMRNTGYIHDMSAVNEQQGQ